MIDFRAVFLSPLAVAAMASSGAAQGGGQPDGWQIGVIAGVANNPYIGEGTQVQPYPLVTYKTGPLSIGTLGLEYEAYQGNGYTLSVGLLPRFSGLFNTDADELDGIDREITGDLALILGYDLGAGFNTGLRFRQEVTGEHDGQEVIFDFGYGTKVGKSMLQLRAGAGWQSEDLSGYVWGVSADEARAGRPEYAPGDVIIPFVEARMVRPINERWSLMGGLRADFLPSDVSNSPIVDEDNIYSATFGVMFNF